MKNIILAALISITSSFAFCGEPAVGDYAVYSFTANGVQGTSRSELTAYDVNSNSYIKTSTTTFNGQTQTQQEVFHRNDLSSTNQLMTLLAFCEDPNVGGVLEQLTTAAGTFDTCKLPAQTGGTVNMAVVPFGIVDVNTADLSMELIEYSFAK